MGFYDSDGYYYPEGGNYSDDYEDEEDEDEDEITDDRDSSQESSSPPPNPGPNRISGNPGITALADAATLDPAHVEIYAYNKKEGVTGSTLLPIAIRARRDVLEASSPVLRGMSNFDGAYIRSLIGYLA